MKTIACFLTGSVIFKIVDQATRADKKRAEKQVNIKA